MEISKNNYTLQTGVYDKPQIISFDSLFDTYSVNNIFGREQNDRIASVINEWKGSGNECLDYLTGPKERRDRPFCVMPTFAEYAESNSKCSSFRSSKAAHVTHSDTPELFYKIFTIVPGTGHPMANTLRAPMASIIAQTIINDDLTDLAVPKEGLFPLISKQEIEMLDEDDINIAFITCSEKINVWDSQNTVEKVKESSEEFQQRLATQCCHIPSKTGLGDFRWHNFGLQKETNKLYILDTEPLYAELFIDKFGEGFTRCKRYVNMYPLKKCAKQGLSNFKESSQKNSLEIFENTAQSFLEKLD